MMRWDRAVLARNTRKWVSDWPLHIATVILIGAVLVIAPRQIGIVVYKAALLMLAAIGAYWIDRGMFGREPGKGDDSGRWQLVALICTAMIAAGLAA